MFASSPAELATASFPFEDSRLPEMLFRYRAGTIPKAVPEERGPVGGVSLRPD